MQLIPHQWQLPQPTVGSSHSHPDPGQRPVSIKAVWWTGPWEATPVIAFFESRLIDSGIGFQCQLCEHMALKFHPLGRLLELEDTEGCTILYLGYIEVNLQIPGIKSYNEDVLLLVILTMTYSEKVLVMVRSKIIDRVIGMMTKGKLAGATVTLKQAHFSVGMSGSLQLPLDDVQGPVHTTWRVNIPPFGIVSIHGSTGIQGHCMQVHMLAEPAWGPQLLVSVIPTATHGELRPGSSWVVICLRSANPIEVPTKAIVGKVAPAKQVPLVVLLTHTWG